MRIRLALLLCLLLPPLGLLLMRRPWAALVNLPLTACLWLPGCVHALCLVYAAAARERPIDLAEALAGE
ncbi:MAG: YqaE/Pmp3 family membrane protein [Phycisphaerales bacterium]|nr:YqaE/Pmp3 family membrane protein [Phycisphaerales bacterium]